MIKLQSPPKAILFDLDGTLVDSAPDLGGAIQDMQRDREMPITPIEQLRPFASAGARGLIGKGFGIRPTDISFDDLKEEFLNRYEARISQCSVLFDGIEHMLQGLNDLGITWGIVTNKHERFALPLVQHMQLQPSNGVIVGGDTTGYAKPHPAPCLEGAKRLGVNAAHCWYVGDDERDIQAGASATMGTIATAYGYCGGVTPIQEWGADAIIHSPLELNQLIRF